MNVAKQVFKIILISILLLLVFVILRHPHKAYYQASDEYVYGYGNASREVRSKVLEQLNKFQIGYLQRDTEQVETFLEELFSKENVLVLGTMPDEIYKEFTEVEDLIYRDWNAWGDVTFLMDTAHISSSGNVAWISTIGFVEFDLSRFLVLPLRLSAVMVEQDLTWKFQYMQF